MRFTKAPPPRKRKRYSNAVTDDPAFRQLVKAMHGDTPRAALSFELDEAEKLKIAHPWRVAADALRKIIADENLPYVASKYQTDSGGWAVQVVRTEEERPATAAKEKSTATEEGRTAKSA
jgi:hypothetical protein